MLFQKLDDCKAELDRLNSLHSDTAQTAQELDQQKRHLRDEIKQLKLRERQLISDYSELEEENITLQKQVCLCCCMFCFV